MPFNGNGVFQRVRNWQNDAASGIKIRADRHDSEDDNLANGLSQCLTRDGQSTPTGNLPMGGYSFTNVGNASQRNMFAAAGQVQDNVLNYAVGTGSANVYAASVNPSIPAYVAGQIVWVKVSATNTGASTLNVNGLGAKPIKTNILADVAAGDVVANSIYGFIYDGTNFIMTTPVNEGRFSDAKFQIYDDADATKKLQFQTSGITTATTRTLTVQDLNGTLPVIVSGSMSIPATAAGSSSLVLFEDTDNGTNKMTFVPPAALAADRTITYSDASGTAALLEDLKNRSFTTYTTSLTAAVIPFDNTIPQSNEGSEIFAVSFATRFANSKVRLRLRAAGDGVNVVTPVAAVFINAGTDAVNVATGTTVPTPGYWWGLDLTYEHTPGSTTAVTYRVRVGGDIANRLRLNGNTGSSFGGVVSGATLEIEEIFV